MMGLHAEECIYGFVYELYQNTFGLIMVPSRPIRAKDYTDRSTANSTTKENLPRNVRASRLSFEDASQFSERLKIFYGMKYTLRRSTSSSMKYQFPTMAWEILSRFRAVGQTASQKEASLPCENLQLLNRIIAESLSSDARKSNIGRGGLHKALRAVDQDKGICVAPNRQSLGLP